MATKQERGRPRSGRLDKAPGIPSRAGPRLQASGGASPGQAKLTALARDGLAPNSTAQPDAAVIDAFYSLGTALERAARAAPDLTARGRYMMTHQIVAVLREIFRRPNDGPINAAFDWARTWVDAEGLQGWFYWFSADPNDLTDAQITLLVCVAAVVDANPGAGHVQLLRQHSAQHPAPAVTIATEFVRVLQSDACLVLSPLPMPTGAVEVIAPVIAKHLDSHRPPKIKTMCRACMRELGRRDADNLFKGKRLNRLWKKG